MLTVPTSSDLCWSEMPDRDSLASPILIILYLKSCLSWKTPPNLVTPELAPPILCPANWPRSFCIMWHSQLQGHGRGNLKSCEVMLFSDRFNTRHGYCHILTSSFWRAAQRIWLWPRSLYPARPSLINQSIADAILGCCDFALSEQECFEWISPLFWYSRRIYKYKYKSG